jgi:putative transposase
VHSEIGQTPLHRFLQDKDVGRPCPSALDLQMAFTAEADRSQRRSDGSISLEGIRYEVPSRFGHLERVLVRYAVWNLGLVYLADPKTGAILGRIYPQDKKKNAEGRRAARTPVLPSVSASAPAGMAPLLQKILRQYATTGLPPAYLPKDDLNSNPS